MTAPIRITEEGGVSLLSILEDTDATLVIVESRVGSLSLTQPGGIGPRGPRGLGVLVLPLGSPVPTGTPIDTVIFRREA